MNPDDPYLSYYRQQQAGRGVTAVYRGAPYQRGHGVGSFLGGLFRTIAPILRSGAATIGREALRSGVGFLGDVAVGSADPRQAAGTRFRDFSGALKRKADEKLDRVLRGGGIRKYKKRRVARVTPQSLAKLLRARTSRVKRKQRGGGKTKKGRKVKTARKRRRQQRRVKRRSKRTVKDIFGY